MDGPTILVSKKYHAYAAFLLGFAGLDIANDDVAEEPVE